MDIFQAVSDQTRRDIIEMLARKGQLTASNISKEFTVSPSAISQHLKVLLEVGIIVVERRAQQRLYMINPEVLKELSSWMEKIKIDLNV